LSWGSPDAGVALVGRWRAGEGVVTDLLPGHSSGGRGTGRLPDEG
jgi:putative transposase